MSAGTSLPSRARARLSATDLHVARGARPVLTGVDLSVSAGDRLGVVGENGRGKTTLLQVLAGRLTPDSGRVHRTGSTAVADQELPASGTVGELIDVELAQVRVVLAELDAASHALAEQRPGADDDYERALAAAEALDAWDADRRVQVSLAALDAVQDRDRPLAELSVGQRYRIRLACVLGAGYDLLLLDEPTNHLDAGGLAHLTERLQAHPGAAVLVTHDRALLADTATAVLDLDPSIDGRSRTYGGGYAGFRAGRRAERERWEAEHDRQEARRARLTRDLDAARDRLVTGWRPDKGTGKHARATRAPGVVRAVHRRQEELDAHAVPIPQPPQPLRLPALPTRPGTLLRAVDAAVPGRFAGRHSVRLRSGDRLVVTGPNGAGKSSLLGVLAGALVPDSGAVHRTSGVRVGLLAQETRLPQHLVAADVVAREVARHGNDDPPGPVELGLLDETALRHRVGELSAGQRRRLDLAVLLAGSPHIVLFDEPTNHLSPALVDELIAGLADTGAAVVLATHDRQLLRETADWPLLQLAPHARSDAEQG
ncbi:ABC-F family ATP-binding cassette domain-containing protein [Saccharopolyspora sp. HNM0983]|uniref:ABC-F family ATP-binding cassette domain-containing protein n=1 Tax=Saccharopolyspora montiporae TaxID=2781240 RepID=A0A929B9L5_9PSEU|nr:ATP-binding cassette domain-containing protein [Saccharopolyspora sp. HNM0983]MBE9373683.1 ABC-F family ATP-binding cassette domain-containing protein [Saccharopolyspora sp. HNM0983]